MCGRVFDFERMSVGVGGGMNVFVTQSLCLSHLGLDGYHLTTIYAGMHCCELARADLVATARTYAGVRV